MQNSFGRTEIRCGGNNRRWVTMAARWMISFSNAPWYISSLTSPSSLNEFSKHDPQNIITRLRSSHAQVSSLKCDVGGKSRASKLVPRCTSLPQPLTRGIELVSKPAPSMAAATRAASPSAAAAQSSDEPRSLKSRLLDGEKLYGAFSVSFSNVAAEILGWSGYDYVVIDMEHGVGDTFDAFPILQALASTKTPAIIRIPYNEPYLVKKALDAGPAGIMFPMVQSAEEARRAIAACRYPPLGIRGAAHPIVRASRYGLNPSYIDTCEQDLLILIQIETETAVNRIQEILEVEGVDCIQMGPLDMRASLGLLRHPDDPKPLALLKRAETAVLSFPGKKVLLAGFFTADSPPGDLFARGCHLVAGAIDVALLREAAVEDVKKNKPKVINN